ncbi:SET domain-containing protein-lysine N-methyltransferase [Thermoproteota archaeon]
MSKKIISANSASDHPTFELEFQNLFRNTSAQTIATLNEAAQQAFWDIFEDAACSWSDDDDENEDIPSEKYNGITRFLYGQCPLQEFLEILNDNPMISFLKDKPKVSVHLSPLHLCVLYGRIDELAQIHAHFSNLNSQHLPIRRIRKQTIHEYYESLYPPPKKAKLDPVLSKSEFFEELTPLSNRVSPDTFEMVQEDWFRHLMKDIPLSILCSDLHKASSEIDIKKSPCEYTCPFGSMLHIYIKSRAESNKISFEECAKQVQEQIELIFSLLTLMEKRPNFHPSSKSDHDVSEKNSFYTETVTWGIDVEDSFGWTPLHYAVFTFNYEAIKMLLKLGANPDYPDRMGLSPRDYVKMFSPEDPTNQPYQLFNHSTKEVDTLSEKTAKSIISDLLISPDLNRDFHFHSFLRATPEEFTAGKKNGDAHLKEPFFLNPCLLIELLKTTAPRKDAGKMASIKEARSSNGDHKFVLAYIDKNVCWGTFAAKDIEEGEYLGLYCGQLSIDGDIYFPARDNKYASSSGVDIVSIDSKHKRNLIPMINHSSLNNADMVPIEGTAFMTIRANQSIPKGKQVTISYNSPSEQQLYVRFPKLKPFFDHFFQRGGSLYTELMDAPPGCMPTYLDLQDSVS